MLRRAAIAFGVLAVAAAVVAVAVNGIGSGAVGNGGGRIGSTSSNFRFTWWSQAWHGFTDHVLWGTGAGSFHLLNLRYRTTYLDFTIEPHNLPVQVLAELGLIGLVLLVVACVMLLRGSFRRSGHELALALLLPAFLVHSLVDVDWDFAAVAAPAFVAAGALVGGPAVRRLRGFSLLPALGVGLDRARLARLAVARAALGDRGGGCSPRRPERARDHACEPRARARPVPARAVLGEGRRRTDDARGVPAVRARGGRGSRRTRSRGFSPASSR